MIPTCSLWLLQRTTETKFFRAIIDSGDELCGRFPKTAMNCSRIAALLGSIAASAFTGDQLRMISDFADRRCGGLLRSVAVARLPRRICRHPPVADGAARCTRSQQPETNVRVRFLPRALASRTPSRRSENRAAVSKGGVSLPQVISVNPIRQLKPGANGSAHAEWMRMPRIDRARISRYGRARHSPFRCTTPGPGRWTRRISVET